VVCWADVYTPASMTEPRAHLRSDAPVDAQGLSGVDPIAEDAADEAAEERRRIAKANLLLRIAEQVDFPTIQESVSKVRQKARSDHVHLAELTQLVVDDVGLTSKLLRIVNAAFYTTAGAGTITSMKRAVALIGVENLELLVATLMVFDRVPKGRNGEAVRHACSTALLSAWLAQHLCESPRHMDAVYLSALFMNLGEMLVSLHAPADSRRIQKKIKDLTRKWSTAPPSDDPSEAESVGKLSHAQSHAIRQHAARDVIGLSFEELGCEVAHQWGWPDHLVRQLRSAYPSEETRRLEVGSGEYLRVLCTAASDLATTLGALPVTESPGELEASLKIHMERFQQETGRVLGLDVDGLIAMGELAVEQRSQIASFLDINPEDIGTERTPSGHALAFKPKVPPVLNGPERVSKGLELAHQSLRMAEVSVAPLDEILQQLVVDLHETLRLQRVVICLRDPASGELRGVAAHGLRAQAVMAAFQVPLANSPDIFSLLCDRASDALIADAADPTIWRSLPRWYSQKAGARTFLVLPMLHRSVVHGLLYADRQMAGSLVLNGAEFKQLQDLRDQLLATMVRLGYVE